MSSKVELIPVSEGNRITVKEEEKVLIGRGSSLGCNDKKISRQHAELFLKKDDTLWVKPTHTNPVFYRPAGGKRIELTKDVEQELKDGDQIGLLPTNFFFRVSFSTETNDKSTVPSDESKTTDSDSKSRKLPTWMSTSDGPSSVKRPLSEEKNNDSKTDEPPAKSSKPAPPKTFDTESCDSFDSTTPKKLKTSDKRRSACPYGASCYRKNIAHRTEQSHPGDSDYEEEKDSKDNDKKDDQDAEKPVCPYGASCYRKNPEHKRDYKH